MRIGTAKAQVNGNKIHGWRQFNLEVGSGDKVTLRVAPQDGRHTQVLLHFSKTQAKNLAKLLEAAVIDV